MMRSLIFIRALALALGTVAIHVTRANTPPALEPLIDVVTVIGMPVQGIPLRLIDAESPPEALTVTVRVSNASSIPTNGIRVEGTGATRWLSLTPNPSMENSVAVQITVTVTDPEGAVGSSRFSCFFQVPQPFVRVEPIGPLHTWDTGVPLSVPVAVDWSAASLPSVKVTASDTNLFPSGRIRIVQGRSIREWTLLVHPTPGRIGQCTATVTAKVMEGADSWTFPLTVDPAPFRPSDPGLATRSLVTVADLNRDGRLDWLTVTNSRRELWIVTTQSPSDVPDVILQTEGQISKVEPRDFDGDGRIDLAVLTGRTLKFWRNTSTAESLTLEPWAIPGVELPTEIQKVLWGDFDGNGSVDAILLGSPRGWMLSVADGASELKPLFATISPMGSAADADGDGDLDLMMASRPLSTLGWVEVMVWPNDGRGRFSTNEPPFFEGLVRDLGWEDFDGDGLPEPWLVVRESMPMPMGTRSMMTWKRFQRSGERYGLRTELKLDSQQDPRVVTGDFDQDGVVDLVRLGSENSDAFPRGQPVMLIQWGDGSGGMGPPVTLSYSSNALIAVDREHRGRLDLIHGTQLLENQNPRWNSRPSVPVGLKVRGAGGIHEFSWLPAMDLNQSHALTYNLRVGTYPGGDDVVSSRSLPDGTRLVADRGNVGWRAAADLDLSRVRAPFLYWSVQAIDHSLAGGPFAEEQVMVRSEKDQAPSFRLEMRRSPISRLPWITGTLTGGRLILIQESTNLSQWRDLRYVQPDADGFFLLQAPFAPVEVTPRIFRAMILDEVQSPDIPWD